MNDYFGFFIKKLMNDYFGFFIKKLMNDYLIHHEARKIKIFNKI